MRNYFRDLFHEFLQSKQQKRKLVFADFAVAVQVAILQEYFFEALHVVSGA